jgi:hypothetical protein
MKEREEVLAEYQKRVGLMKAQKTNLKDIRILETTEILLLRALLHPTAKQESKDMTRELIYYLCDKAIVTAEDIYSHFGWSDNPVMKRLKIFKEFALVKRESKKYYLATPRLYVVRESYMERVCGNEKI